MVEADLCRTGSDLGLDDLAMAAKSRDTAALEELLLVAQPDIRKFAIRLCNAGADAEDAEDAVQHTLSWARPVVLTTSPVSRLPKQSSRPWLTSLHNSATCLS